MSSVTDIITGAVSDGYIHQFQWWFAGYVVGTTLGLAGFAVRLLLLGRRGSSGHEI